MTTGPRVFALLLAAMLLFTMPLAPAQAADEEGTGAADLVVESIEVVPADPQPNEVATISVKLANTGDLDADYFAVRVTDEDYFLYDTTYVEGLAAGANITVEFSTYVYEAHYLATAIADPWGWVSESNESNNEATLAFTVGDPAPDLMIDTALLVPAAIFDDEPEADFPWATVIREGDPLRLFSFIENGGTEAVVGNVTLRTYLDDVLFDERTIRGDCDCRYQDFEVLLDTWNATVGDHTFRLVADPYNAIDEKDETNNEFELHVSVLAADAPVPDLAVVDISVPELAQPGDWVTVTATVQNTGDADAEAFHVWLDVYDLGSTELRMPGLDVNESFEVSLSGALPIDGNYYGEYLYWQLVVDPWWYSEVPEANETNNYQFGAIPLLLPDLVVTGVSFSEGPYRAGEPVPVFVHVCNEGTGSAQSSFEVEVEYGHQDAVIHMSGLSPGLCAATPVDLVPDRYASMQVEVDPDGRIGESDDWNNFFWDTFEFGSGLAVQVKMTNGHGNTVATPESPRFEAVIQQTGDITMDEAVLSWYVDGELEHYEWISFHDHDEVVASFTWAMMARSDDQLAGYGDHQLSVELSPYDYDDDYSDNFDELEFTMKLTPLPGWV